MRYFNAAVGIAALFTVGAIANAGTCPLSGDTNWTFGSGLAQCGSNSSSGAVGVNFTNSQGQIVTLFADQIDSSNDIVNASSSNRTVNGLFEVQKGNTGNIASGIGPFDPNQGASPYTGQLGIADGISDDPNHNTYSNTLYLEITGEATGGNTAGDVQKDTTLNFLMQEGFADDTFNVWTGVFSTGAGAPNLTTAAGMTEIANNLDVSTNNTGDVTQGRAVNPQFSVLTGAGAGQVEYIAIQADCEYLLLNSIGSTPPGHQGTPEPRFYALLLVGLLAIPAIRRKFAPVQ